MPASSNLFGYTASEVIGKSISILIPPDRQEELPEIVARIRMGEIVKSYETVRVSKDGTLIDCISKRLSHPRHRTQSQRSLGDRLRYHRTETDDRRTRHSQSRTESLNASKQIMRHVLVIEREVCPVQKDC